MPIFEFMCGKCRHQFEALVRKMTPKCPSCGSEDLERLFSLPNVKSDSTRAKSMKAAKTRDQKQAVDRVEAQRAYEASHDD